DQTDLQRFYFEQRDDHHFVRQRRLHSFSDSKTVRFSEQRLWVQRNLQKFRLAYTDNQLGDQRFFDHQVSWPVCLEHERARHPDGITRDCNPDLHNHGAIMKLTSPKLHSLWLLVLFCSSAALAQSIALAPAQIVEDFKPGVPFEYSLAVANNGNDAVELHVQITDFWYNAKNEKIFNAPGTSPRSAANWIQFVPEKFEVPAGGSQKMKAIITPPVDARGGYYAVLFVESKPIPSDKTGEDGRKIFTNMRIGCLVLLTGKDSATYNVKVDELKLVPP